MDIDTERAVMAATPAAHRRKMARALSIARHPNTDVRDGEAAVWNAALATGDRALMEAVRDRIMLAITRRSMFS